MSYQISEKCKGCGACKKKCPWGAITGNKKEKHLIDPSFCQECGTCWFTCPTCAVLDSSGQKRPKEIKPHVPKAVIHTDRCVGCQNCFFNCQQHAINFQKKMFFSFCSVDSSVCIGCGCCRSYCAGGCIELA